MKTTALILALFSFQAFAEVPEVVAKDMTCIELKDALQNYGSLTVVTKVLLFKKRITIHKVANCSYDERVQSATFKTSNARYCNVGEFCATYHEPSSSTGYSDYSDYSSGSSSGNDSWSSGSSDSSSSGSDSSSSSTRGPSYNPPSSGTRGPRYCPSC